MPQASLVRIIVNPISGRRGSRALVSALVGELRRKSLQVEVCNTTAAGDAERLAAAAAEQCRAVLVVGGDGTVREAAAGLLGHAAALAICPMGTENLAATYFGFRADAAALAAAIAAGRTRRIDVARANGRPFLMVAGFGFDAEVVRRLSRARRGHISYMTYVQPVLRTLGAHRFPVLHVEADGQRCFDGPGMAFVGNVPRYAMGLPLLRQGAPDDGLLDVCVFSCDGRARLLVHALRVLMGTHVTASGVIYRQARHVRIGADGPTPVEIDGDDAGDVGGVTGMDFTVAAGALNVVIP